ncbi:MAG: hypothetical protein FJW14_02900 [Acidimicrobiia bacterium]|nr:hypothetical protein [Acidimicrobiia bacterium]
MRTGILVLVALGTLGVSARQAPLPPALREMADTERAFAARALAVGWKQSFLEFFSDAATGFGGQTGPAKALIRKAPDPPRDAQLLWEPRFGDIAASGELGWLTGPVTSINPARGNTPRYSNYSSVWKREGDAFKVVMDLGTDTPDFVPYAPGFTRAPASDRYTGDPAGATESLRAADAALNTALLTNQQAAYRGRMAEAARLHRSNLMPLIGETAALAWLATQKPHPTATTEFAEAARSADLGYAWGHTGKGFYTRVWSRGRSGDWKVALDVVVE